MDAETRWWTRLAAYIALASVGGVLGYIMRSIDNDERPSLCRSIVEGISAGFAGVVLLLLCQALEVDERMIGVIVGIGGWLGASATIRRLEPFALGARHVKNPSFTNPPDHSIGGGGTIGDPVGPSGAAERKPGRHARGGRVSEEVDRPP